MNSEEKFRNFTLSRKKTELPKKTSAGGSAYFEENTDGTVTLHLGIETGKAKAARIKKNGKKTFKKLGLDVNVYNGE